MVRAVTSWRRPKTRSWSLSACVSIGSTSASLACLIRTPARLLSASQVALRSLVQQGVVPIPRTARRERLPENLASLDFALSDAEVAEIDALKRPDGRVVNPPHAPKWDS